MSELTKKNAKMVIEGFVAGDKYGGENPLDTMIEITLTDWDEEASITEALHEENFGQGGKCNFMKLVTEGLVDQAWKAVPDDLQALVDKKKFTAFIDYLEDGDNLKSAAINAKIDPSVAGKILKALEKKGLL